MNNVFVTGVNGLLGTNLCNDLLEGGFVIKGLVRDRDSYKGVLHNNLQLVEGSLYDDHTSILNTIDCVIHIAAITQQNLLKYSEYKEINYYATAKLFRTAIKCGVKRFVFISTAGTIGFGTETCPGTESNNIDPLLYDSFYTRSKMDAELYLLQHKKLIDTIIINPAFMIGPFDTKPSSGKIILMCWNRKIVFYPPGGKSFVHVKDVSAGIINSMKNGKTGERYLLANENLSYKAFFNKVNRVTGQKPIMIKVPELALLFIGVIGDFLRLLRVKTTLSLVNMKMLCINNFFSNDKSRKELKVIYHPVDMAIEDAVRYFKDKR